MTQKRFIIVGAGIIGASIAWHLAKAGAQVTVLDSGPGGGVATRNSWAWINASWGNPEVYFRLRERSMLEWRRIDRDVPGMKVDWCGGLIWDLPPEQLEAFAQEHAGWGYGIRRVGRSEILGIEPNLKQLPEFALHIAEEGKVEPLSAALAFLEGAEGLGATVLRNSSVRWLEEKNGKVTGAAVNDGVLHCDELIVAAGEGTGPLLSSIDLKIDLTAPPGLLVHSKPTGELLRGLVMAPELHVRQTSEGRLVAGSDFSGSIAMDDIKESARDLYGKVKELVSGSEDLEMDFHTVGHRPTPADGYPAVGRLNNLTGLYVAVMHSGITLAPAIGLFASSELLNGVRDNLLSPYHPDRLLLN